MSLTPLLPGLPVPPSGDGAGLGPFAPPADGGFMMALAAELTSCLADESEQKDTLPWVPSSPAAPLAPAHPLPPVTMPAATMPAVPVTSVLPVDPAPAPIDPEAPTLSAPPVITGLPPVLELDPMTPPEETILDGVEPADVPPVVGSDPLAVPVVVPTPIAVPVVAPIATPVIAPPVASAPPATAPTARPMDVTPPEISINDQQPAATRVPGAAALVVPVGTADPVVPGAVSAAPGTTTAIPARSASGEPAVAPAPGPVPEPVPPVAAFGQAAARVGVVPPVAPPLVASAPAAPPVAPPVAPQIAPPVATPARPSLAARAGAPVAGPVKAPTADILASPTTAPDGRPVARVEAPVAPTVPVPRIQVARQEHGPVVGVPRPFEPQEQVEPAQAPPAALASAAPAAVLTRPMDRPVAAASPVQQVFPEVVRLAKTGEGTHRITMTLRPEHLGEVRVTLVVRDGSVRVNLSSEHATDALAHGAHELRRLLEHTGMGDARIVVRDATATGADAPAVDTGAARETFDPRDADGARGSGRGPGEREENPHRGASRDARPDVPVDAQPAARPDGSTGPQQATGRLDRLM
ncbi:hypothetical protein F0U44_15510 [Nocardioides humilatus]|uniref:Flagellar hook-length control protein-like C-terminal domain-containing protein n=1 Tax=Nocardioides humilatus TaxID=2607660 RepID=A0A5B1LAC8_9ACTN|nr:flagellar hook-length control protein FliK [Nocardioides humilatus]KAA1417701.1 hypothetical protein F0U44_15510 [Nocardioides humilatus]